jgi:penicillin-binding protein 2
MFGLGEAVSIESPASEGLIPDAEWKRDRFREMWYPGETISFAIGQGYVQVTPLQMAVLVAAVANDGEIVTPTLLRQSAGQVGKTRTMRADASSFKAIKQGMLRVTDSRYGTGQLARVDFMRLAAKTGTAQAPPKRAHAWFTGFFPYENPKVAVVVFVEHGGSGGIVAAQMVRRIVDAWHSRYATDEKFVKPALPPVALT